MREESKYGAFSGQYFDVFRFKLKVVSENVLHCYRIGLPSEALRNFLSEGFLGLGMIQVVEHIFFPVGLV